MDEENKTKESIEEYLRYIKRMATKSILEKDGVHIKENQYTISVEIDGKTYKV